MNKDTIAVHLIIHGRVQGVCYRAWTVAEARALNLTGWVRNRSDGTVEAIFCGSSSNVDTMIRACHSGPALARVDRIEIDSMEMATAEDKVWSEFHQRDTV